MYARGSKCRKVFSQIQYWVGWNYDRWCALYIVQVQDHLRVSSKWACLPEEEKTFHYYNSCICFSILFLVTPSWPQNSWFYVHIHFCNFMHRVTTFWAFRELVWLTCVLWLRIVMTMTMMMMMMMVMIMMMMMMEVKRDRHCPSHEVVDLMRMSMMSIVYDVSGNTGSRIFMMMVMLAIMMIRIRMMMICSHFECRPSCQTLWRASPSHCHPF